MIQVGGKPILLHIMKLYAKYGFKDFYIALGYKGQVVKKFFKKKFYDWNINLIDTGKNTMTGGRLKRLKKYIGNERFMMTYERVTLQMFKDMPKISKVVLTLNKFHQINNIRFAS